MNQYSETTGIYVLVYSCVKLSSWLGAYFNIVALYLYVKDIPKHIRILKAVKTGVGVNYLLG